MKHIFDPPKERNTYGPIEQSLKYWFEDDVWSFKLPDWGVNAKPFDLFCILNARPIAIEVKVIKTVPEKPTSKLCGGKALFNQFQQDSLRRVTLAGGFGLGLVYFRLKKHDLFEWRRKFGIAEKGVIDAMIPITPKEIAEGISWEPFLEVLNKPHVPAMNYYPWGASPIKQTLRAWDFRYFEDYLNQGDREWL